MNSANNGVVVLGGRRLWHIEFRESQSIGVIIVVESLGLLNKSNDRFNGVDIRLPCGNIAGSRPPS